MSPVKKKSSFVYKPAGHACINYIFLEYPLLLFS